MQLNDVVNAGVAQLVEQLFCKQKVGGSIPLAGLKLRQPQALWRNFIPSTARGQKVRNSFLLARPR